MDDRLTAAVLRAFVYAHWLASWPGGRQLSPTDSGARLCAGAKGGTRIPWISFLLTAVLLALLAPGPQNVPPAPVEGVSSDYARAATKVQDQHFISRVGGRRMRLERRPSDLSLIAQLSGARTPSERAPQNADPFRKRSPPSGGRRSTRRLPTPVPAAAAVHPVQRSLKTGVPRFVSGFPNRSYHKHPTTTPFVQPEMALVFVKAKQLAPLTQEVPILRSAYARKKVAVVTGRTASPCNRAHASQRDQKLNLEHSVYHPVFLTTGLRPFAEARTSVASSEARALDRRVSEDVQDAAVSSSEQGKADVIFRPQNAEENSRWEPPRSAMQVAAVGDTPDTSDRSEGPSLLAVGEDGLTRRTQVTRPSRGAGWPKAATEHRYIKEEHKSNFEATPQLGQPRPQQLLRSSDHQNRQSLKLGVSASSFLASTTKDNGDEGESDEGGDKKQEGEGSDDNDKGEKSSDSSGSDESSEDETPPPKKRRRGLPGFLGAGLKLAGTIARGIFG